MKNSQAKHSYYLKSMGIDVWLKRKGSIVQSQLAVDSDDTVEFNSNLTDWSGLQNQVESCNRCSLAKSRTQAVFGNGNKQADWMLIGEAPGHHEDLEGQPFVGQAGQLLTEMIRALGLEREQVYIANILKCRPPKNRDPKKEEIEQCYEYLQKQVDFVQPQMILAVGRIAAQTLLKTDAPLAKLRNKEHQFSGVPMVVVYHPAYLLRSLIEKRKAWQDLQFALQLLRNNKKTI